MFGDLPPQKWVCDIVGGIARDSVHRCHMYDAVQTTSVLMSCASVGFDEPTVTSALVENIVKGGALEEIDDETLARAALALARAGQWNSAVGNALSRRMKHLCIEELLIALAAFSAAPRESVAPIKGLRAAVESLKDPEILEDLGASEIVAISYLLTGPRLLPIAFPGKRKDATDASAALIASCSSNCDGCLSELSFRDMGDLWVALGRGHKNYAQADKWQNEDIDAPQDNQDLCLELINEALRRDMKGRTPSFLGQAAWAARLLELAEDKNDWMKRIAEEALDVGLRHFGPEDLKGLSWGLAAWNLGIVSTPENDLLEIGRSTSDLDLEVTAGTDISSPRQGLSSPRQGLERKGTRKQNRESKVEAARRAKSEAKERIVNKEKMMAF